ncbi:hypothetical protein MKX01_005916, partial [Papaver californicum]
QASIAANTWVVSGSPQTKSKLLRYHRLLMYGIVIPDLLCVTKSFGGPGTVIDASTEAYKGASRFLSNIFKTFQFIVEYIIFFLIFAKYFF